MFIGFMGGLAKAFNSYPVNASRTGGSLGSDAETHLEQHEKRAINAHKKLPREVGQNAVIKMQHDSAKEKRKAELLAQYSKYVQAFAQAKAKQYKIRAEHQQRFMDIARELAEIDSTFNKAVNEFQFGKSKIQAELSGYQAACSAGSAFRPF